MSGGSGNGREPATRVYLSVDTEFSIAGAFDDPVANRPVGPQAVYCDIDGRSAGLGFLLETLGGHGARFPWLMYNLMGRGVEVSGADTYRSGVRCKFLLPDLKRLWRILRYPERIQDRSLRFDRLAEVAGFVAFLLDPRSRYYVFSWSDPGPFLAELRQLARRLPGRS